MDKEIEEIIEDSPTCLQDVLRSFVWGNSFLKSGKLPEEGLIPWDATLGDSLDELL